MIVILSPVESWHVDHVAANIRAHDAEEIWAAGHMKAHDALTVSLRAAVLARTGLIDGEPVCVFGVSPASLLTGIGTPWMLATPSVHHADRTLVRLSRPIVEAMQAFFALLVNWVDARNARAIRWLTWLGFTVEPARPYGMDGLPFHRFTRSV
jgi:hypothetical protein